MDGGAKGRMVMTYMKPCCQQQWGSCLDDGYRDLGWVVVGYIEQCLGIS